MRHRVAFLGTPHWLNSPQLQRLRLDRRIITVDSRQIAEPAPCPSLGTTIVVVQLGSNAARALTAIESMSRPNSAFRCIAVTHSSDDRLLRGCVEAGAWGLVLNPIDAQEYLNIICSVGAGRLAYSQDVLDRIVTHRGRMTLAGWPRSFGPGGVVSAAPVS